MNHFYIFLMHTLNLAIAQRFQFYIFACMTTTHVFKFFILSLSNNDNL